MITGITDLRVKLTNIFFNILNNFIISNQAFKKNTGHPANWKINHEYRKISD
jgi:hypothetical protein